MIAAASIIYSCDLILWYTSLRDLTIIGSYLIIVYSDAGLVGPG